MAWRILFTFLNQVLDGNYSSTEQVNSIQQLLAYSLIIGVEVDIGEIIYSDLVTKLLNKSRLKYVSYPRFISCALQVLLGLEASGALSKKRQKPKSKKLPTETKGTRKSQPLPESTATPPKDSGGNVHPFDKDLTSTTYDKGTTKTTPRPEGSLGDKDSGGNKPPADMEPINPTIADH
ncbi:hypothetical protein Tco_0804806 [Tanacetum coccineum]|uniref:Uncharacterized protein n=1 Tax=Tanacetum coccineum TaxID=301880 RepID=A0ABQ5A9N4_9ASTR